MKLFLISQDSNNDYDTYDSAVVCAPNEDVARVMNPSNGKLMEKADWRGQYSSWCAAPELVTVEYLGKAADTVKPGIVCSSFNAG